MTLHLPFWLAATALTAAAGQAAEPERDKYKPGNIIVSFEGGVVGEEMGRVLMRLTSGENLLPAKPHQVVSGETPCGILIDKGYPLPCSQSMLRALDHLNAKLLPSRGRLKIGDALLLPDVWLRRYRTGRTFTNSLATERQQSAAIKGGWSHLKLDVRQKGTTGEQINFSAYELIFETSDPARQNAFLSRINALRSDNVRISVIGFEAAPAKAYFQTDPTVYQQDCSRNPPPDPPPQPREIDYGSDYSDLDGDLSSLVGAAPAGSQAARVSLIDVALDPSPNLAGAVEGQQTPAFEKWRCAWTATPDSRVHATHLAGIIASRPNGYGFVGIAPTAIIVPYVLLEPKPSDPSKLEIPPGRELKLADKFDDDRELSVPQVYLVATSFSPYEPRLLNSARQIDPRNRTQRALEQRIIDLRPLLVVAAGQDPNPVELSPRSSMSPQNLGDQWNVLVVTACKVCKRTDTRLFEDANFSERFVHVAAPGGSPVLGWVNRDSISALPGTSPAAAFAAGVVAEMISRWPQNYQTADKVKKRIQVTSWPIYQLVGQANDDHTRVATGVVDPRLALLNPSRHWLKDGNGWREVRLKAYSAENANFSSVLTGSSVLVPTNAIARIVRVTMPEDPAEFVIYSDVFKRTNSTARLAEVSREGPLQPDPNLKIELCGGESIAVADVVDFVVANSGPGNGQCAP